MSDKVSRLQSAVEELLESINAYKFEIHYEWHKDPLVKFSPSTIEDYGLTEKDME